jgi:hypothetical protein
MSVSGMTRHRRLLALVCIALVVVAGVVPGAAYVLCDALVPLGPLFGLVIVAAAFRPAADVALPPSPVVSFLALRAPPAA